LGKLPNLTFFPQYTTIYPGKKGILMSKVFLSYNRQDEGFVRCFYERLKADGVDCFFDKESIPWGANWVVELEKGLDDCEFIILILSPDFCKSEWTKLERTSVMADDPEGRGKKIRPLLLKDCKGLMPRFLKPIQFMDISLEEKFEKRYPDICRQLGEIQRKRFNWRTGIQCRPFANSRKDTVCPIAPWAMVFWAG
jgi:hypothetical protein